MTADSLLDVVPVIPVVVVHDAADAVPIARALVDGLNKLEQVSTEQSISEFTDVDSWMPRL